MARTTRNRLHNNNNNHHHHHQRISSRRKSYKNFRAAEELENNITVKIIMFPGFVETLSVTKQT